MPLKVGYARVSTKDQTIDLQLDALKKAGCGRLTFNIFASLAEFERDTIRERTARRVAGRTRGRHGRGICLLHQRRLLVEPHGRAAILRQMRSHGGDMIEADFQEVANNADSSSPCRPIAHRGTGPHERPAQTGS